MGMLLLLGLVMLALNFWGYYRAKRGLNTRLWYYRFFSVVWAVIVLLIGLAMLAQLGA